MQDDIWELEIYLLSPNSRTMWEFIARYVCGNDETPKQKDLTNDQPIRAGRRVTFASSLDETPPTKPPHK